ncbi:MAG: transposase [Flavobacterium psychrophilum]|nr:MAG: transposase [Flavobacterium psychrophilum]
MKELKVARYIRVSTGQQSTLRQDIKANKEELIFTDKGVSGSIPFAERPAGKKLLKAVADGTIQTLMVSELSRLGRNTLDILTTIEYLHKHKVNIHIEDLNGLKSLNSDGTVNQLFSFLTTVLSGISTMERESINQKIRDGIKAKKDREGLNGGRPKGTTENDSEVLKKYPKVIKMIQDFPKMKQKDVAKSCEIDARTVKKVKEILDKQKQ